MSLLNFTISTKAVYFEDYISYDEQNPFAVRILDENNKEVDMFVFPTKDAALSFIEKTNNQEK